MHLPASMVSQEIRLIIRAISKLQTDDLVIPSGSEESASCSGVCQRFKSRSLDFARDDRAGDLT
jgi:hypothetical protein